MARVGGEEIDLTPTDGMAKEAQKALDWRKDGFDGGTAVGLARARQLVNKQELSPSTVRRMHSFFSRHEVDKQGEGFSPGEPGYPSNGRVAWALWGGDPGQTWARAKSETLDRLEGKSIDYTKEFTEEDAEEKAKPGDLKLGDFVQWNSSGGMAKGRIEHIMTEGVLGIPDSDFSIQATKEDPAALIRIYRDNEETDTLVGHKFSTLTKIPPIMVDDDEEEPDDMDDYEEDSVSKSLESESSLDMVITPAKPTTKMFTFDSTIKAIDAGDGELKIDGYASTVSVDRSSDVILSSAWNKSGGLNNFKANPILLFNHNYDKPIGKVVEMGTDSKGLKIKGVISKSAGDVYNLVKEGVLTTFSVGFMIKDADYNKESDGLIIKDAELLEISVVSVPCNQDATFSVAKSFDSQEDYLTFRKQFENALGGQPLAETGGSSEGAETASRKIKMDEETINAQIQKGIADAMAAKAAAEAAAAAKAAEALAAEEKIVAKVLETGSEKLYAEMEKRFKDDKTELDTKLEGLRNEIAEKSSELQAIANSKRVFADRSDESWKKTLLPEMENAFLLGRITGKGYETEYAKNLLQKANTMSSVSVPSTDHFEREVTTNIEREIQLELVLAPLFREIQMNSASMILPIMPDTSYAAVNNQAGSATAAGTTTLDERSGTGSGSAGIALREIDLRTVKMVAKTYLANETEEDAIIPILPLLREAMIRQHGRGVENLMLMGGASSTGNVPAYNAATLGANTKGLITYADTNSRSITNTAAINGSSPADANAVTAVALLALRKQMGKYGIRPADVVYVVSQTAYFDLLQDSEFQDFNLVGNLATKMTGEVGQIFGSSVLVCDEFAPRATGAYAALAVNTRNFVVPRQRGVTVESQYLVENQHRVLTTTQRLGFREVIENVPAVVGLKYGTIA
jgi:HK97 family phage prohead protease